uniref:B30.2/SPRY domain-containing protein n=1 Tax=Cyprinodon variegatus TaxID=28743 RepID=A0A3Q2EF29_CYPVA
PGTPSRRGSLPALPSCPQGYFEDVTAALSELREKLQDVLRDTWTNISVAITKVDVLQSKPEPCRIIDQNKTRDELDKLNGKLDQLKNMQTTAAVAYCTPLSSEQQTRAWFLRHARKITLNPNTAHKYLELSEGNRKVTMTNENQYYPDHEDRFTRRWQVLSKQRLSGRIYWEVEWSGRGVEIAVAYDEIEREGDTDESTFGLNENSWALCCKSKKYTFSSDGWEEDIDESVPVSSTVGVYLDTKAGILSFYSVFGSKMIFIHQVQAHFDAPLYAGVWLSRSVGTTAEFIQLK